MYRPSLLVVIRKKDIEQNCIDFSLLSGAFLRLTNLLSYLQVFSSYILPFITQHLLLRGGKILIIKNRRRGLGVWLDRGRLGLPSRVGIDYGHRLVHVGKDLIGDGNLFYWSLWIIGMDIS